MAFGSIGVDIGRGEDGIATEDGCSSARNLARERRISSTSSPFKTAEIKDAISELDVGGLFVDGFHGVSKQRLRIQLIAYRILHPETS
jgi:hypothetical protein